MLETAGHDVLTVTQAQLNGRVDSDVFQVAIQLDRVILTSNCADFVELHDAHKSHSGILLIYQDHDPSKDMSYEEIVKAIANLEVTGIVLSNRYLALNVYNY